MKCAFFAFHARVIIGLGVAAGLGVSYVVGALLGIYAIGAGASLLGSLGGGLVYGLMDYVMGKRRGASEAKATFTSTPANLYTQLGTRVPDISGDSGVPNKVPAAFANNNSNSSAPANLNINAQLNNIDPADQSKTPKPY